MTTKQPEALRLADITEFDRYPPHPDHKQHVAKELRRLHEVNTELLAAYKGTLSILEANSKYFGNLAQIEARAAIAKAEKELK